MIQLVQQKKARHTNAHGFGSEKADVVTVIT